MFNSSFTLSDHVSQVIKSTRVDARDLYRIRPLLDLKASVLLANALVSSRLDYCNSLFVLFTENQKVAEQVFEIQLKYFLKIKCLPFRYFLSDWSDDRIVAIMFSR